MIVWQAKWSIAFVVLRDAMIAFFAIIHLFKRGMYHVTYIT